MTYKTISAGKKLDSQLKTKLEKLQKQKTILEKQIQKNGFNVEIWRAINNLDMKIEATNNRINGRFKAPVYADVIEIPRRP